LFVLLLSAGLYALTPEVGVVSGGSSQQFTLRFSPQEVEDVSRTIWCHMPVLEQLAATALGAAAEAFKQLTREVTGKVRSFLQCGRVCIDGCLLTALSWN
jgi:hypothetical protein